MLQKLAPLIILLLFIAGSYFVIQGMNKATEMSHPPSRTAR